MTAAPNNSMQLEGKTILLGIAGGIAAYKSCNIVRLLQKRGARVKVVMSEHATEFVGPLTFRALTNEPVAVGLFDDPSDPIHHISLAQEPDLVVVRPRRPISSQRWQTASPMTLSPLHCLPRRAPSWSHPL